MAHTQAAKVRSPGIPVGVEVNYGGAIAVDLGDVHISEASLLRLAKHILYFNWLPLRIK